MADSTRPSHCLIILSPLKLEPSKADADLSDCTVDATDLYRATSDNHHHSSELEKHSTHVEDPKGVARVIIYRGCFNPHHVGHLNLLRYVFDHAKCLNIVHAIIVVLNEEACRLKTDLQPYTFAQRKEAWEKDPEFPEWAKVVPIAGLEEYRTSTVPHLLGISGKDLRYITLYGPDGIRIDDAKPPRPAAPDSMEVTTSNQLRPADFAPESGQLIHLPGCSPWKSLLQTGLTALADFTILDLATGQ